MYDTYLSFTVPAETELMAIRFKPGGFFPFYGKDLYPLQNQVKIGSELFGPAIDDLREKLLRLASPEDRLSELLYWLERQFSQVNRAVHPQVLQAVKTLQSNSNNHLGEVACDSGFSQKHFIHLFRSQIGILPKTFQRIIKFSDIILAIQEKSEITWTQISHECGYYDQSHFIRDFKNFSGYNPSEFLGLETDRNNFFPVDDYKNQQ